MDRVTKQVSELSEHERFQLLLRLAKVASNSVFQSNLSAVTSRRPIQQDIPVSGYVLHGSEPEPVS
jgi:hypothetical protein